MLEAMAPGACLPLPAGALRFGSAWRCRGYLQGQPAIYFIFFARRGMLVVEGLSVTKHRAFFHQIFYEDDAFLYRRRSGFSAKKNILFLLISQIFPDPVAEVTQKIW